MLDFLLEEPRDTPWNKWVCGTGFPILVLGMGIRAFFLPTIVLTTRSAGRRLELTGSDPWWLGLVLIGAAGLAHFHFFWTNHPRLAEYVELGKVISLMTLIVGIGVIVVRQCRPF